MDFKDLIAYIQRILDKFFGVLPEIQKQILENVLNKTQQLELSGNQIRISAENLKKLADVQSSLRKIFLSDSYMKAVGGYAKAYGEVTKLQHSYFQTIEANYGGPALAKEMMKIAKENVVSQLTETGLMANVAEPVKEVIRRAITSGSSYATLQEQLNEIAGKDGGILERYTKQISTDAINQYSRQYSQLASADLDLEWFRYAGSNIKTTRPFCLACTDRKYFHISEIPALLRGDFPEFKKHDGKIYDKTDLPQGMYPETDVANFPTLLGGYNCGHQYRPISDKRIPDEIKQRVYESVEYKVWKGMAVEKEVVAGIHKAVKPDYPDADAVSSTMKQINDEFDTGEKWFENGVGKLAKETNPAHNGSTTKQNGNIWLSGKRLDGVRSAMGKIGRGESDKITFDEADSIATYWHEITHNRNRAPIEYIGKAEAKFMELANEFVARKTLPEFYKKMGVANMPHKDFMTNRDSTGYNKMVNNYDYVINELGLDSQKVLDVVRSHLYEKSYKIQRVGLSDGLKKGGIKKLNGTAVKKSELNDLLIYCRDHQQRQVRQWLEQNGFIKPQGQN